MFERASVYVIVLSIASSGAIGAEHIVNHANADPSGLSQEVMDLIGDLKVYFAHASVGGDMSEGMASLHDSNPVRYQLSVVSEDGTPPGTTVDGTFYHYARGNPGWEAKISSFATYVANGWSSDTVDVAMNKLCYIDEEASWTVYRDSMLLLEATYPDTFFVYMTMPLTTDTGGAARDRHEYNENLREWAEANNKILFDIADIEAWSPDGVEQTFVYGGETYQKMYSGYTYDGGHLNAAGQQQVAEALYTLYGRILTAPEPTTLMLLAGGGALLLRRKRR